MRNSNTPGPPDLIFNLGNPGDIAIAGDWNGDGIVTLGVFRPSNGTVYLRNSNSTGFADDAFVFGNPGDLPVAGDWDGDGVATVGVFRSSAIGMASPEFDETLRSNSGTVSAHKLKLELLEL